MKVWKSLIALTLAVTMGLGLAACSTRDPAQTGGTSSATPAPTAQTGSYTPKNGESLNLVLLVPGLLGDKSFFDATNSAMDLIQSELGA